MDMVISSIKLNLLYPIGSISQRKLDSLDQLLLEDYPLKQIPDGKTVIYVNAQKGMSLIIGPAQISFGMESIEKLVPRNENQSYIEETISMWNSMAKAIALALMLDEECDAVEIDFAAFVSTLKDKGKEAADNSIQKFSPIHRQALKEICEPIAVGLRYIYEREQMLYDCRIEPSLANLSQYFYTMNTKTKKNTHSFEEAFTMLEANLEFYQGQWFTFIKDSILI